MINKTTESEGKIELEFFVEVNKCSGPDPVLFASQAFYADMQGYFSERLKLAELPDIGFNFFKSSIKPEKICVLKNNVLLWLYAAKFSIIKSIGASQETTPEIKKTDETPSPVVPVASPKSKATRRSK
jgi:hypothetical protein